MYHHAVEMLLHLMSLIDNMWSFFIPLSLIHFTTVYSELNYDVSHNVNLFVAVFSYLWIFFFLEYPFMGFTFFSQVVFISLATTGSEVKTEQI